MSPELNPEIKFTANAIPDQNLWVTPKGEHQFPIPLINELGSLAVNENIEEIYWTFSGRQTRAENQAIEFIKRRNCFLSSSWLEFLLFCAFRRCSECAADPINWISSSMQWPSGARETSDSHLIRSPSNKFRCFAGRGCRKNRMKQVDFKLEKKTVSDRLLLNKL